MSQKSISKEIIKKKESILALAFLVFGLIKPLSSFDFTYFFVFGIVVTFFFSNLKTGKDRAGFFIVTVALALILSISQNLNWLLAVAFIFPGGIYAYFLLKYFSRWPTLIVFHLILFFLISSFLNSSTLRTTVSKEPQANTYSNDYLAFLRNYYLVEKGYNYYDALVLSHTQDVRSNELPPNFWNWRMPTYVYLWQIFPGTGGYPVYLFFLLISSSTMLVVYWTTSQFLDKKISVLSPYLVLPYFHFAARDISFLAMEWFGLFFVLVTLFFVLKRKFILIFISGLLAALLRETFIVYILSLTALSFIFKKYKIAAALILSFSIFLVFLIIHVLRVYNYIPTKGFSLENLIHQINPLVVQQTLAYASQDYLLIRLRPFLIALTVTLLCLAILLYRKRLNFELLILPISSLCMVLVTASLANLEADYWGITFVPLILISSLILSFKTFSAR